MPAVEKAEPWSLLTASFTPSHSAWLPSFRKATASLCPRARTLSPWSVGTELGNLILIAVPAALRSRERAALPLSPPTIPLGNARRLGLAGGGGGCPWRGLSPSTLLKPHADVSTPACFWAEGREKGASGESRGHLGFHGPGMFLGKHPPYRNSQALGRTLVGQTGPCFPLLPSGLGVLKRAMNCPSPLTRETQSRDSLAQGQAPRVPTLPESLLQGRLWELAHLCPLPTVPPAPLGSWHLRDGTAAAGGCVRPSNLTPLSGSCKSSGRCPGRRSARRVCPAPSSGLS